MSALHQRLAALEARTSDAANGDLKAASAILFETVHQHLPDYLLGMPSLGFVDTVHALAARIRTDSTTLEDEELLRALPAAALAAFGKTAREWIVFIAEVEERF